MNSHPPLQAAAGAQAPPFRTPVPFRNLVLVRFASLWGTVPCGTRRDWLEPELKLAFGVSRHEIGLVSHRMRTVVAHLLEQAQKDDCVFTETAVQGDPLAGFLGPLQLGVFYEKGLLIIPTGNLHEI